MTVKELKEKLSLLPDELEIEVDIHFNGVIFDVRIMEKHSYISNPYCKIIIEPGKNEKIHRK